MRPIESRCWHAWPMSTSLTGSDSWKSVQFHSCAMNTSIELHVFWSGFQFIHVLCIRPKWTSHTHTHTHTHTHNHLTALCPGLPGWPGTRKVQPIWILLKQETVSDSGISWAICKSAPRSRQITTPASPSCLQRMPFLSPNQQRQSTKAQLVTAWWTVIFVVLVLLGGHRAWMHCTSQPICKYAKWANVNVAWRRGQQ